jgi:hypothetical protein
MVTTGNPAQDRLSYQMRGETVRVPSYPFLDSQIKRSPPQKGY